MPDPGGRGGEELEERRAGAQRGRDLGRGEDAGDGEQSGGELAVEERAGRGAARRGSRRRRRRPRRLPAVVIVPAPSRSPSPSSARVSASAGRAGRREGQLDRAQAAGVQRLGDPHRLLAVARADDGDGARDAERLERVAPRCGGPGCSCRDTSEGCRRGRRQLLVGDPAHLRRRLGRVRADVRGDDDVVAVEQRLAARRRLVGEHVEPGAADDARRRARARARPRRRVRRGRC